MVAGGLALGGLVLNLLLVAGGVDDLITRNVFALWMPAAVLVSGGLGASRARRVGLIAAAALCAIGIVTAVGVARDRAYQRPDWRPVAALIGRRPGAPRAIFVQHYLDLLPLSLYLPGLQRLRATPAPAVSEIDVVTFAAPPGHVLLVGLGVQPVAVADAGELPAPRPPRGLAPAGRPVHGAADGRHAPAAAHRASDATGAHRDLVPERRVALPALSSASSSVPATRR